MFISMEGVPLRQPAGMATKIIHQLQNIPIYLLGVRNTMIGKIMASAFESISLPALIT